MENIILRSPITEVDFTDLLKWPVTEDQRLHGEALDLAGTISFPISREKFKEELIGKVREVPELVSLFAKMSEEEVEDEFQDFYRTLDPTDPIVKVRCEAWGEPEPLPEGLPPVAPFDKAFLPESIGPWVEDIGDRMQCPPDFVGVAAIVALGSVIGRRVSIRPQRHTDWCEVANLWGCIVGKPGVLKSPATNEALNPLRRLETKAREDNAQALKYYLADMEFFKLKKAEAVKKLQKELAQGGGKANSLLFDEPQKPLPKKYIAQDVSYEKLGEILQANPNGVLVHRDELVSLLKNLDDESNIAARGFYLAAWDGKQGYDFDRIGRGQTYIPAACLSLLGTTQPGIISEYLQRANSGQRDDGLIQRFGLFVWPDSPSYWKEVDHYPDTDKKNRAWDTFQRLNLLTPEIAGAQLDGEFGKLPFLRFSHEAQEVFSDWRGKLEHRLRDGELGNALESHLSKYRGLIPALSLINHLADGGKGSIGIIPLTTALAFSEYLETHAKRAYSAGSDPGLASAKAILGKIEFWTTEGWIYCP